MRFIILAFLCYLLYRIWRGVKGPGGDDLRGSHKRFDEMVQDPECGTYIPVRGAMRHTVRGHVYYFCSRECADKFESRMKKKEEP